MNVLVTGGAGFIGSHLVEACVAAGDRVRVLDDLRSGRRENLEAVAGDVELIEGSITDAAALQRAVRGCDRVFHQAAVVSVPETVADPLGSHRINATGTLQVLLAARAAGVARVVFASSCAVYGDDPRLPKTEDMAPRPLSPYALQKWIGEQECALAARDGLETVVLRYFNVYGPRQDERSSYAGVIPRFVSALARGDIPVIFGDGAQTRDFVHVSDVVAANLAAAAATGASPSPLNVGRGARTSVRELLDAIAAELGAEGIEPRRESGRAGDVRDSEADPSRAREALGWTAGVGLREGLRDTVAWYRQRAC